MGSLIDELQRPEAAAREEAEELRGQIAQLTERLAGVEERLLRLVITRETVDEALNGDSAYLQIVLLCATMTATSLCSRSRAWRECAPRGPFAGGNDRAADTGTCRK